MRTIAVIFTEERVSLNEIPSYKKYKFLCNYDIVSLYDMVEDLAMVLVYISTILYSMQVLYTSEVKKMQLKQPRFLVIE